jgi:hypothetical protein
MLEHSTYAASVALTHTWCTRSVYQIDCCVHGATAASVHELSSSNAAY